MPGRVAENFDAIAFGVSEVDRNRVAMGDRSVELNTIIRLDLSDHRLYVCDRLDPKRIVINARLTLRFASGDESNLVMIARTPAQENDQWPFGPERPSVSHLEAQHVAVEGGHGIDVASLQHTMRPRNIHLILQKRPESAIASTRPVHPSAGTFSQIKPWYDPPSS